MYQYLPDLLSAQRGSFFNFLLEGLKKEVTSGLKNLKKTDRIQLQNTQKLHQWWQLADFGEGIAIFWPSESTAESVQSSSGRTANSESCETFSAKTPPLPQTKFNHVRSIRKTSSYAKVKWLTGVNASDTMTLCQPYSTKFQTAFTKRQSQSSNIHTDTSANNHLSIKLKKPFYTSKEALQYSSTYETEIYVSMIFGALFSPYQSHKSYPIGSSTREISGGYRNQSADDRAGKDSQTNFSDFQGVIDNDDHISKPELQQQNITTTDSSFVHSFRRSTAYKNNIAKEQYDFDKTQTAKKTKVNAEKHYCTKSNYQQMGIGHTSQEFTNQSVDLTIKRMQNHTQICQLPSPKSNTNQTFKVSTFHRKQQSKITPSRKQLTVLPQQFAATTRASSSQKRQSWSEEWSESFSLTAVGGSDSNFTNFSFDNLDFIKAKADSASILKNKGRKEAETKFQWIPIFWQNEVKTTHSQYNLPGAYMKSPKSERVEPYSHSNSVIYQPQQKNLNKRDYDIGCEFNSHLLSSSLQYELPTKKALVSFGRFPLMTNEGSFIINGARRIIMNQIIRCPNLYYKMQFRSRNKRIYTISYVSDRGVWLRIERDESNYIWIRINNYQKIPLFIFLRALGITDEILISTLSKEDTSSLWQSLKIGNPSDRKRALQYLGWVFRKGKKPLSVKQTREFLNEKLFHPQYYSLTLAGRLSINKKYHHQFNQITLSPEDLLLGLSALLQLEKGKVVVDDIDHLKNKRIRLVHELLQNQIRRGFKRLQEVREKNNTTHPNATPSHSQNYTKSVALQTSLLNKSVFASINSELNSILHQNTLQRSKKNPIKNPVKLQKNNKEYRPSKQQNASTVYNSGGRKPHQRKPSGFSGHTLWDSALHLRKVKDFSTDSYLNRFFFSNKFPLKIKNQYQIRDLFAKANYSLLLLETYLSNWDISGEYRDISGEDRSIASNANNFANPSKSRRLLARNNGNWVCKSWKQNIEYSNRNHHRVLYLYPPDRLGFGCGKYHGDLLDHGDLLSQGEILDPHNLVRTRTRTHTQRQTQSNEKPLTIAKNNSAQKTQFRSNTNGLSENVEFWTPYRCSDLRYCNAFKYVNHSKNKKNKAINDSIEEHWNSNERSCSTDIKANEGSIYNNNADDNKTKIGTIVYNWLKVAIRDKKTKNSTRTSSFVTDRDTSNNSYTIVNWWGQELGARASKVQKSENFSILPPPEKSQILFYSLYQPSMCALPTKGIAIRSIRYMGTWQKSRKSNSSNAFLYKFFEQKVTDFSISPQPRESEHPKKIYPAEISPLDRNQKAQSTRQPLHTQLDMNGEKFKTFASFCYLHSAFTTPLYDSSVFCLYCYNHTFLNQQKLNTSRSSDCQTFSTGLYRSPGYISWVQDANQRKAFGFSGGIYDILPFTRVTTTPMQKIGGSLMCNVAALEEESKCSRFLQDISVGCRMPTKENPMSFLGGYQKCTIGINQGDIKNCHDFPRLYIPRRFKKFEGEEVQSHTLTAKNKTQYSFFKQSISKPFTQALKKTRVNIRPYWISDDILSFPKKDRNLYSYFSKLQKPISNTLREFFGLNPLSQFMDQINPLGELTQKRRLTSLGPGGVTREAGLAVRDIHPSYYGRICPIETPEGKNAGLVNSLSSHSKINTFGFLETGYTKPSAFRNLILQLSDWILQKQQYSNTFCYWDISVGAEASTKENPEGFLERSIDTSWNDLRRFTWITAEQEEKFYIASIASTTLERYSTLVTDPETKRQLNSVKSASLLNRDLLEEYRDKLSHHNGDISREYMNQLSLSMDEESKWANNVCQYKQNTSKQITCRYNQSVINLSLSTHSQLQNSGKTIEFATISATSIISIATSLIPFLEHDDGNRALMGSNMQRQGVPLFISERAIVGTGMESQSARDSRAAITSNVAGKVTFSDCTTIEICHKSYTHYSLPVFERTNQNTLLSAQPTVQKGDTVRQGDLIAETSSTKGGELSIGTNLYLAYLPWEGYNFEDAIVINQRLVYEHKLTSVHVEKMKITTDDGEEFFPPLPESNTTSFHPVSYHQVDNAINHSTSHKQQPTQVINTHDLLEKSQGEILDPPDFKDPHDLSRTHTRTRTRTRIDLKDATFTTSFSSKSTKTTDASFKSKRHYTMKWLFLLQKYQNNGYFEKNHAVTISN
jgi:DNA-directed RNA polymerase beta subunit